MTARKQRKNTSLGLDNGNHGGLESVRGIKSENIEQVAAAACEAFHPLLFLALGEQPMLLAEGMASIDAGAGINANAWDLNWPSTMTVSGLYAW